MGFTHRRVRSSSGQWPRGCPRPLMVAGCGWSRAEQSRDSESPADGRRASWGHSGSRPLPAYAYGHSSAARGSWSESPPGAGAGRSRREPGAPGGGGHRPLRGWRRRHAVQGAPPCPGTNRPSPSPQRSLPRRPRRPASAPAALPRPLPAPGAPARGALCSPARTHADAAALPSRPTAVFGLCCRFLKTLKS